MEAKDLAGLGEVLNSDVANKGYDDAASGPMKQIGEFATECLKAFRYFTRTIQYAAAAQDRLQAELEEVRNSVPEERRVEAKPSIAGPVMRELVFMEDENPLRTLYMNLLKRAIDKDRQEEAHPAFPSIIAQLSPDEALLLHILDRDGKYEIPPHGFNPFRPRHFPIRRLVFSQQFWMYVSHLEGLRLLTTWKEEAPPSFDELFPADGIPPGPRRSTARWVNLSEFGRLFRTACMPEDFPDSIT